MSFKGRSPSATSELAPRERRLRQPRGSTMLLVLLLLAALTAVALASSELATQAAFSTTRIKNEPIARGLAETCADHAMGYALRYIAVPNPNFTALLASYVPPDPPGPALPVVTVPKGIADPLNLHKYKLYRNLSCDAVTGACGACLVRYDDNLDDGRTGDAFENLADDDDGAIFVTAVGLYPVDGSVAAADVYATAQTRVTIKRFVGNRSSPGIWAGGDIDLGNNTNLCGTGGIQSDTGSLGGGTSCVCGDVNVPGMGTPAQCGSPAPCASCAPVPANAAAGPQPDPVVKVPEVPMPAFGTPAYRDAWMKNEWFGAPSSSANQIGFNGSAVNTPWKIYVRDMQAQNPNTAVNATFDLVPGAAAYTGGAYGATGEAWVFAWDDTETDPNTVGGRNLLCFEDAAGTESSANCADVTAPDDYWRIPSGASAYCANYAEAQVKSPCNWNAAGKIVCARGESPCWKPIAILKAAGVATIDGTPAHGTNLAFTPANAQLPDFEDATRRWGDIADSDKSTGALDPSCTSCALGNTAFSFNAGSGDVTFAAGTCNDDLPTGIYVFEQRPTASLRIPNGWGNGCATPLRSTLVTNQDFDGGGGGTGVSLVGAVCGDNPGFGTCTSAAFSAPATACVALRAFGDCVFGNQIDVQGQVRCGTIDINNNGCLAGGLVATNPANVGKDCSGGGSLDVNNNADVVGDVLTVGAVCINNNLNIDGNIGAQGDVQINNNATVNGQIVAEQDIDIGNNLDLTFSGGGAIGGGARPVAWLETTW